MVASHCVPQMLVDGHDGRIFDGEGALHTAAMALHNECVDAPVGTEPCQHRVALHAIPVVACRVGHLVLKPGNNVPVVAAGTGRRMGEEGVEECVEVDVEGVELGTAVK